MRRALALTTLVVIHSAHSFAATTPQGVVDPVTHFSVSAPASTTAGSAFSFTITALTASNAVAIGYAGTVHFTSSDGNFTLPADYTFVAGDNGTHTSLNGAILRTAGNQTITATDTGNNAITGTASVTVAPATATHFFVGAPAVATAGTGLTVSISAFDQFNNTDTGYSGTVHFTSTDGAATLPSNTTLTNGSGSFSATLKTAGNQTITATDTVTMSITGTSGTVNVSPASATHFSVTAPASVTAGATLIFTVTARDAFNNQAAGYSGTVHFSSSDSQAGLPPNATLTVQAGGGSWSLFATLGTAGNQTITATDINIPSITGTTNNIMVNAAAATHYIVNAPPTASQGAMFSFTVVAKDQFNNTATAYAGTVHFTSSDGAATLPPDSTLTNGAGTFAATLNTTGNQTITVTDTITPSITATTNSINVGASNAATFFSVTAPASTPAGQAFSFTITARTATNATATSYSGTVHFTSSDGQAVLPANTTLTNGTGTFSATLKTAGNQTITGTDTLISQVTGTSGSVAVSAGAATHFAVSAPPLAVPALSFDFNVSALDQFNNVAMTYGGTVHFTSSDPQAVLPADSTLSSGAGFFSATLKTAGNQTITATDTLTPSVTGSSGIISVHGFIREDFNGDGDSDVTLFDASSGPSQGTAYVMLMNGVTPASIRAINSADPNYTIAGIGDFNGDGKSDILIKDVNNNLGLWFMTSGPGGAAISSAKFVGALPAGYAVAGIGDFDGDGKADILLRHSSGDLVIWFHADSTVISAHVGNSPFNVAGVGDFNGDHKADILFSVSNQVGVWFMSGPAIIGGQLIGYLPPNYAVAGVGDFNGDGFADFLFRNSVTGDIAIWFMTGSGSSQATVGSPGPSYSVANVGDYNGDGKADILLRDTTGAIGMWLMNGASITGGALVANPANTYTVMGQASKFDR